MNCTQNEYIRVADIILIWKDIRNAYMNELSAHCGQEKERNRKKRRQYPKCLRSKFTLVHQMKEVMTYAKGW